jgi:hypothetical protein
MAIFNSFLYVYQRVSEKSWERRRSGPINWSSKAWWIQVSEYPACQDLSELQRLGQILEKKTMGTQPDPAIWVTSSHISML